MPKITSNFPKLHRHIRGTAFVKIEGRTIYFGPFDDPATRQRFDRFIGEWLANGRRLPAEATDSADAVILSVTDLVDRYRVHVEATQSAAHVEHIRTACRLMRRLYGDTPAADFGPMKLRAVRATMIAGDPHDDPPRRPWCRKYIADQVRRLRAMFRWAVSHELLPDAAYRRLTALEPLRRGEAVDRPPVQAVTRFQVRRAWRYMSRQVKALVLLQLLTGARAGELVRLRPKDIDTTGDVWCAKLVEHKTAHRGRERTIYFGPRARRVIAVFMTTDRPIDTPLFSPREADAERRRAGAKGKRRDKQQATAKKTERVIGNAYTTASFRRALEYACAKCRGNVETWTPHQLRHAAATKLRRRFGLEVAQCVLGHSSAIVTDAVYAARDANQVKVAMKMIG